MTDSADGLLDQWLNSRGTPAAEATAESNEEPTEESSEDMSEPDTHQDPEPTAEMVEEGSPIDPEHPLASEEPEELPEQFRPYVPFAEAAAPPEPVTEEPVPTPAEGDTPEPSARLDEEPHERYVPDVRPAAETPAPAPVAAEEAAPPEPEPEPEPEPSFALPPLSASTEAILASLLGTPAPAAPATPAAPEPVAVEPVAEPVAEEPTPEPEPDPEPDPEPEPPAESAPRFDLVWIETEEAAPAPVPEPDTEHEDEHEDAAHAVLAALEEPATPVTDPEPSAPDTSGAPGPASLDDHVERVIEASAPTYDDRRSPAERADALGAISGVLPDRLKPVPDLPDPNAEAAMPYEFVFPQRRTSHRLLALVLALGILITIGCCWWAFSSRSLTAIGIAAVVGVATAIIWAARAGDSVARLAMTGSRLTIQRAGTRTQFDLADPHTPIEIDGAPGDPDWQVRFVRRGMSAVVVTSAMVDPVEFIRVLDFHRPPSDPAVDQA